MSTSNNYLNTLSSQSINDENFREKSNYLGAFPGLAESIRDDGFKPLLIDIRGFLALCNQTADSMIHATNTGNFIQPVELVILWTALLVSKMGKCQYAAVGRRLARQQNYQFNEFLCIPGIIGRAIESLGPVVIGTDRYYPTMFLPKRGGKPQIRDCFVADEVTNISAWSPAEYLEEANKQQDPAIEINFDDPGQGGWLGVPSLLQKYTQWVGIIKRFYYTWVSSVPSNPVVHSNVLPWIVVASENDYDKTCYMSSLISTSLACYSEAFLYRFLTDVTIVQSILAFEVDTSPQGLGSSSSKTVSADARAAWKLNHLNTHSNSRYKHLSTGPYITQLICDRGGKIGGILAAEMIVSNIV